MKAIITDLDRTLLRSDKTISTYTLGVLAACRRANVPVMVATARPWRTAQRYCDMIGADAIVVGNQYSHNQSSWVSLYSFTIASASASRASISSRL